MSSENTQGNTLPPLGIYIHIPFCRRKCIYCDFYSLPLTKSELENSYIDALLSEIKSCTLPPHLVDTIYLGGGTPSLLSPAQLELILTALAEKLTITSDVEISLEANPDSVTEEKLLAYRRLGVNRISFGVQSASDKELATLSRLHDFSGAVNAITAAQKAGFVNISADLMIATPHQTREGLLSSVDALTALPITHLSAYILKVEGSTPLFGSPLVASCMSEEETADCYLEVVRQLGEKGFSQYEISNFCIQGYESRHNMKYWRCEEYIGFGPSAHSFIGKIRFANPPSLTGYLSSPGGFKEVTDPASGGVDEQLLLGLRLNQGVPLSLLKGLWKKRPQELLFLLKRMEESELLIISNDLVALTPKGFLVSNIVISILLDI